MCQEDDDQAALKRCAAKRESLTGQRPPLAPTEVRPGSVHAYLADLPRRQRSGQYGRPRHDGELACIFMQAIVSWERGHMLLCARSERPWSVHVGAVFDGDHGDLALVIVDTVDHAIITTAGTVKPF
jgi:hypothetical protein